MALGAGPEDIVRLLMGDGARLAGAGLCAGLVLALAAGRLFTHVTGARAAAPTMLASVAAVVAGVVLLAFWLPARRARRTDPMAVLRCE